MLTAQFKLNPTIEQEQLLLASTKEYIRCVNMLTHEILASTELVRLSPASFQAELPSAVKNEVINTAKSVVKKHQQGTTKSLSVLKNPVIIWNNQNHKLVGSLLEFPAWIDGKSCRILVASVITPYQLDRMPSQLGALRITRKN